ncbi:hypothetical protein PAHAL_8G257300 [Panicum hallii]|uniref:Uncharacterized protein n=1 Tax=Panicum hallii TaxID=206008 RepID=A0A2T8IA88_9POAL|nr:hypothetical protein PAHAL_8G257300 [Panicum hallii]
MSPHGGCLDSKRSTSSCTRKTWMSTPGHDEYARRVTRSTVPRCEVQVVMITPGYALAPLTGIPGPAYARENPGRSSDQMCG